MQVQAGAITAIMGAMVSFSFGIWNESLTFLLVLMAIDYFTGVTAAIKEGSGLNSNVGFWGLFKKGLILLVLIIAHRLDLILGVDAVMGSAVFFYMMNELLSVIENYGRLGLPLPEQLKRIVLVLRDRAGESKPDVPAGPENEDAPENPKEPKS
ncbi:phage holin family protein [Cohnella mopanensis]|uniref:phage holin family protein n=1 Tax=Cohnella mopanensis TaxID=2911966 RepID=UPI001EF8E4E8|nr:phage holin family protein [Cohnella mopanensis]